MLSILIQKLSSLHIWSKNEPLQKKHARSIIATEMSSPRHRNVLTAKGQEASRRHSFSRLWHTADYSKMRGTDHQTKMEHTELRLEMVKRWKKTNKQTKKLRLYYIRRPNIEDSISCLDGKSMLQLLSSIQQISTSGCGRLCPKQLHHLWTWSLCHWPLTTQFKRGEKRSKQRKSSQSRNPSQGGILPWRINTSMLMRICILSRFKDYSIKKFQLQQHVRRLCWWLST